MKIAIQAADLDAPRIDGTRVYITQCLKYFGKLDSASEFLIYHKNKFNSELVPPVFSNYKIIAKPLSHLWTQTVFAFNLWQDRPAVLWMPMHNIPLFRRKKMKTVVTIHDLAFKYFPETFTKKDLFKINLLTRLAVNSADRIITISESSKKDILKFYPRVKAENIKVISHGFDPDIFAGERNKDREMEIRNEYGLVGPYLIYIGAIQPRKNLEALVEAFDKIRASRDGALPRLRLVLVGERAWLSDGVFKKIEASPCKKDIICPGRVDFETLGHLLRGAEAFVFPSLYEGFGIPILEAFAARVPVICADNSSLPEVGGEAAVYFDGQSPTDLAEKIKKVLSDENLRKTCVKKGLERIKKFSWEKCAQETLEYLKS
ncbi:MAG: glycosyltransferase family 1 protein [Candidatus Pacebacteria bacterium]|nr:glycosyltransferase family 1 protein [Candidatus Paceibacterota bacterium]MDR3582833.1 glycosyltransferase family 1 protein [Candidatus Paceibacterota bacterium]